MSKYFKVGSRDDDLAYFVIAPDRGTAIKVVEEFTGPIKPSLLKITELPGCPEGYIVSGGNVPQILTEE
jgi:hypothetical protein